MNVKWTFNLPSASHMGGVWERMIRLVRKTLMAVTPKQTLYDDDLKTLFAEVEAIVNSRPLTDVPIEMGEETPLTPNDLLRINPSVACPFVNSDDSDCYSRQRFRVVQYGQINFGSVGSWSTRERSLPVANGTRSSGISKLTISFWYLIP